jgi:hypothetical protein
VLSEIVKNIFATLPAVALRRFGPKRPVICHSIFDAA